MCDVECPYKTKCTSYPNWCQTCVNNTGKKNYYKAENPHYPYNPWYPYTWPYTWGTSTVTCTTNGNYYQQQK